MPQVWPSQGMPMRWPGRERRVARAAGHDLADDLVAGDQRQLGLVQVAVDHMQVGPADRAGRTLTSTWPAPGTGSGNIGQSQRLARRIEEHGPHHRSPCGGRCRACRRA